MFDQFQTGDELINSKFNDFFLIHYYRLDEVINYLFHCMPEYLAYSLSLYSDKPFL